MEICDYNGEGRWSAESVQKRYAKYACQQKIFPPRNFVPRRMTERGKQWIYPIMFQVIKGINQQDKACIIIGIEFIEEDQPFPFGRVLKSNTAKALRHADLSTEQKERIRKRVVHMLVAEYIPREYREYAKLLRKIGMGDWWHFIQGRANLNNPYVARYYRYFKQHVLSDLNIE